MPVRVLLRLWPGGSAGALTHIYRRTWSPGALLAHCGGVQAVLYRAAGRPVWMGAAGIQGVCHVRCSRRRVPATVLYDHALVMHVLLSIAQPQSAAVGKGVPARAIHH